MPGQAHVGYLVTGQAQLDMGQNQQPGPAIGSRGRAQLGHRPLECLLEEAESVLNREAADRGLPDLRQIGRGRGPPPEPERLRYFGGARQMVDFQANEGAAHQRASMGLQARTAACVPLRDGMQPAPGLELDVSILRIVGRPLVTGRGPGRQIVVGELGAMPPRPARRGLGGGIGVETAARAQAHQQADRRMGQGQAQLDRVVASVEA